MGGRVLKNTNFETDVSLTKIGMVKDIPLMCNNSLAFHEDL